MSKLLEAKRHAVKQGWHKWIRNENDEAALLEGCWFDPIAADHACDFFSLVLRHSKGEWAGQSFHLLDWERDWISRMFGWKRPDSTRRTRQASLWTPKKSGKSSICAGLCLYMLFSDGEPSSEVYSCASSLEHGKIIFNEAKAMVESSPELSKLLRLGDIEIIPSTKRIIFPATKSYYQVLSGNPRSAEGWNIQALFFDELHRQKNDDLFNTLRYGGAARRQPLCPVTISTAGVYDPTSIAWQQWSLARDVESGVVRDTSFLAQIYAADPEDDWTTKNPNCEQVWKKANPSLGHTIKIEDFRRDVQEAEHSPTKQAAFRRYRLNIWSQAAETFIPDDRWMVCAGANTPTAEELRSIEWTAGIDLSSTIDVSSMVLFGKLDDSFLVVPFFWINEEQSSLRQERDGVNYSTWVRDGFMRETPGNVVDYDRIRADINEIGRQYNIKKIALDRWNSTQLATQLIQDGFDLVFFGQGFRDMSGPTKELERLVYDGKLRHGGNPVLRWMIANVAIETDASANVKPSKKKSREKIDGVVALAMAVGVHPTLQQSQSVYDQRGIRLF